MKKVVLTVMIIGGMFIAAQAGDRTDRREYTGHYVFPEESMIEPIEVTLGSDTLLTIFSPMVGEIALECVGGDRFEFPQYGGVIVFERNTKQEVCACRISVTAINIEDITARKQ
jgi:hypothetical protein